MPVFWSYRFSDGSNVLIASPARACRSNPPRPRAYARFVGRPAFMDSSDCGISVK